ncbi:MAG: molybdopterin-dependent oxidoreductase, partial [Pseudomonadota bacterium]
SIDQNGLHVVSEQLYGSPWVSLQTDIDHCDYFLLIGTNPAVSTMCWIGYSPDGWKRILKRQRAGATLVVVDPRETESAAKASHHIAPLPESDWALLLAMIKIILQETNTQIPKRAHYDGLEIIRSLCSDADLESLARYCDVPLATIRQLALGFAAAPRALAVARTGVAQGQNGVLALWLTQVLNVITGRMESEGGVYYASGVLDLLVAGNQLFPPSETKSRLRGHRNVAGSHSLAELPNEITTPGEGQIRALIINSGNPVVSGPEGDVLDAALASLDCLVVIDHFQRESHRHAHWLIPGDHFLERDEINLLTQALSPTLHAHRSHAVVDPPAGMRFEWEFFRDLGLAMNLPLLGGRRVLNPLLRLGRSLGKLLGRRHMGLSPALITRLLLRKHGRLKWRDVQSAQHGLGNPNAMPTFGEIFEKMAAKGQRINMAPQMFVAALRERLSAPDTDPEGFPLRLIGRRRLNAFNSWSTETSAPRPEQDSGPGTYVEISRDDAKTLGLTDGSAVVVISRSARLETTVSLSNKIRPGVAVMEHGLGSRTFDPVTGKSYSHGVNRNRLVSNAELDPLSRVPRLNGTPVRLEAL